MTGSISDAGSHPALHQPDPAAGGGRRPTPAELQALRTNIDQSFADGKFKVNVGLNITHNTLNRGLSNNDNTCTTPIYCFGYTPAVINLDSVTATGQYVRNPFNGGGANVRTRSKPSSIRSKTTFRQIGNLSTAGRR
jgi:hypothetical protein